MDTTSYWRKTEFPKFPTLDKNLEVDVVVVGGGITGVTAAYHLKKAGKTVALLDRGQLGGFDSSSTTAHLTYVTDWRLHELADKLGKETARAVWESGQVAIDLIANTIRKEKIHCEFDWVPGYLFASAEEDQAKAKNSLLKDLQLAQELGFDAQAVNSVPLYERFGIKFARQAKFHPLKYIAALLKTIPGGGSHVLENTEMTEVEEKPLAVKAKGHRIRCSYVVLATHTPLTGKTNIASATIFQSKLFLYSTYAIGAKIPRHAAPEASYWDTGDPYDYLRIDHHEGYDYAILGGEDHKTGQIEHATEPFLRLESKLLKLFPAATLDSQWSGQVISTPDGLPYIGETAENQFAATGYSGNGMTFGTLGGVMAVDAFFKHANPWQELYDVHRTSALRGVWNYVKENKDYPYHLVKDWLARAEGSSVRVVGRDEGKILQLHGKKVAAYRDLQGKVTACSAVCTHLGCIVGWNEAEKTWDCPCHGSRFSTTGAVLTGPAEKPLERIHH